MSAIVKQAAVSIITATLVVLTVGCESKEDTNLKWGVDYVKANIEKIGRDPMATVSFQSTVEQGGDIRHYLAAGMRDSESFPPISMDKPEGSWSIVIKEGPGPEDYTIEGYGKDTSKPMVSVVAKTSLPPTPPVKENINGEPGQDPPITTAAAEGDVGKVGDLIKKGANVNAMSVEGATALMYAATKGHVEVVKLLLAANADVGVRSRVKEEWTSLMCAVAGGNEEIVGMLLEKGADANVKHVFDQTALMNAASKGNKPIVELLLKAGADINAREKKAGNSALALAISKEHGDVVKTLLASGADANVADNNGVSVLMLAASKGQRETAELLLKNGAKPDAKDHNGNDALRYAEHGGFAEIGGVLKSAMPAQPAAVPVQPAPKPAQPKATPVPAKKPDSGIYPNSANGSNNDLVGKTAKEAEGVYGKAMAEMKKGDTVILLFKDAEVHLKNGTIVSIYKK